MRYLVYGAGCAREAATFARLHQEVGADRVSFALTRPNGLLERLPGVHRVSDAVEAIALARSRGADIALVVSPYELFAGAADAFAGAGLRVFGPPADLSRLESSKLYAKQQMSAWGVPTPAHVPIADEAEGRRFLAARWVAGRREYVVKADAMLPSAAARVVVPASRDEAASALRAMLADRATGPVFLEERVRGFELSVHLALDETHHVRFPAVRDYKRLGEDDTGPNTHGMAALATTCPCLLPWDEIERTIVAPTLAGIRRLPGRYRGALYIGIMLTEAGPLALEYNVRPGNPEWIAVLGLLASSFADLVTATATGALARLRPVFASDSHAMAVMAVRAGYPEKVCADPALVTGVDALDPEVSVFGNDIAARDGQLFATGGRVLALRAVGTDLTAVRSVVLANAARLHFDGITLRRDVGVDTWPHAS